jgi:hypothetical protein
MNILRFPFTGTDSALGEAAWLPFLPIALQNGSKTIQTAGLLDTGAAVNVLPYELGLKLDANWEKQNTPLLLTGNLENFEARALILHGQVEGFDPVRLAFAWTKSDRVPLILGQTNFFMSFNVCFFRSEHYFEIKPR